MTLKCVGKQVALTINEATVFGGEVVTLPDEGTFTFQYIHNLTGEVVLRDIRFTDLGKQPAP